MAIYRNIALAFWTDDKIVNKYTSLDKYFYLCLLTNPHTNIIGCYEISVSQMSYETGIKENIIEKLIDRAETIHDTILYSKHTHEIFIKNWHKYNWTKSSKLHKPIRENIRNVKDLELKKLISKIGYAYGIDTSSVSVTDTVNIDNYINLTKYISNKCNYILTNTPIEINTLHNWVDRNVDYEIIKFAFDEAKRRNVNDINYINGIVNNRLETLKKQRNEAVPEWFDKSINKKDATAEEREEMEKLLKEFK